MHEHTHTYAVVTDGTVTNVVVWDGDTPWTPPAGSEAVRVEEGVPAGIGWEYLDGEFVDNRPPEVEVEHR